MNERIRELAEQAHDYTNRATGCGWLNGEEIFEQKFAELIVRECAEVGYDSVENGDDMDDIMRRVHNNILKHFGVKE